MLVLAIQPVLMVEATNAKNSMTKNSDSRINLSGTQNNPSIFTVGDSNEFKQMTPYEIQEKYIRIGDKNGDRINDDLSFPSKKDYSDTDVVVTVEPGS